MRLIQLFVLARLVLTAVACSVGPAWAQSAAPGPAPALPKVQQKGARSEVEVGRLKQDVKKQELHSQQASERLQQQDKAIADLRKQLQELQSSQAGGQH